MCVGSFDLGTELENWSANASRRHSELFDYGTNLVCCACA